MSTSALPLKEHVKIKKIFEDHWERFWRENQHKFPPEQRKSIEEAVEKMLNCGSYKNGYALYQCCSCGKGGIKVGFTCKSRFCARCGKVYTDKWLEKLLSKIANVRHIHIVFTIPKEFRGFFFRNPRFLKDLADMAVETILDVLTGTGKGKKRRKRELLAGMIAVIHTFGRDMKYNPHIHVLLACTAINKATKRREKISYILYEGLHKVWQYKLLNFIKKKAKGDRNIIKKVAQCWQNRPDGLYVNARKPMKNARQAARYLGRYLARPVIAEYRLVEYDGKNVTFWYNDHKSEQREYCTLPVEEFIGRLVTHIPLKHFQMVRRYGFYGRRVSAVAKSLIRSLGKFVQQEFGAFREPKKGWRERLIETFKRDPLKCPHCGDEMSLWEIWHPRFGKIYEIWEDATDVTTEKKKKIEKAKKQEQAGQEDLQRHFEFMHAG